MSHISYMIWHLALHDLALNEIVLCQNVLLSKICSTADVDLGSNDNLYCTSESHFHMHTVTIPSLLWHIREWTEDSLFKTYHEVLSHACLLKYAFGRILSKYGRHSKSNSKTAAVHFAFLLLYWENLSRRHFLAIQLLKLDAQGFW